VSTDTSHGSTPNVDLMDESNCHTLDTIAINEADVMKRLRALSSKSTITPDNIPPMFLKNTSTSLVKHILYIFNLSLTSGKSPRVWKRVLVRPLHKKGNRKTVSNYRPIALTSILCKVLERIIDQQLRQFYSCTNFFSNQQHGFRSRRSTVTSLLTTANNWRNTLLTNHSFHVLYVDFAKAFDVVSHSKLIEKMHNSGIRGSVLLWLADFLSDRTLEVVINDHHSTPRPIPSGVIQGTVIGVTLFSVFIDDLPASMPPDVGCDIFADDTKIYDPSQQSLESAFLALDAWCTKWEMRLAPDKFQYIKIRRRRATCDDSPLFIGNTSVAPTKQVKDLGITITDDLEPEQHIILISKKAHRMCNLIMRTLKTHKLSIYAKAFVSLVRPSLEYATNVWSPIYSKDINILEKVQRSFTRRAFQRCNLPKTTYLNRITLLKWQSLEDRRLYFDLVLVYKIITNNIDLKPMDFFQFSEGLNSGHGKKVFPLKVPSTCQTNTQLNTLAHRTYQTWNNLPNSVVHAPSISSFKRRLKKFTSYTI
jgi:hypothetical protein